MLARQRWLYAALIALGSMTGAPAQSQAQQKPGPREEAARAFVEQLNKGDFDKATQSFDATMTKVMPAAELKKSWDRVVADAGAYQKPLGSRSETKDKYEIVTVTCEFAKAKIDARVVFDSDAKIAGLFFGPAKKSAPTGAEEIYEGTLKVGATEIRIVFHLFKQKDGSYQATMDSPDQGAKGIVLDEASVKDDQVQLEFKSAKIVYEGKRSKDGQEIAGTFKQAGQSFPLTLKRVAKARESRRPQTPQPPFPYEVIEVTYKNNTDAISLAGTLTVPRSKGPFPVVLLITGSGPQDRDETILGHKPFLVLADHLTRHGIAVLRVDDRGVGGSTGSTKDSTSADFANDVLAGVEFLKGRKEINPSQIGLMGHSEGGIIAPLVASRSRDIAFIIMLAGTGVPGEEILYNQAAAILKLAGAGAKQLARQKTLQERIFAVVREEKDNTAAEKKVRAAFDELSSKVDKADKQEILEALPMLEGQIQMVLTPWFRHFLAYDPRPALRKVTCPVLALNGEKDVQVDPKLNLPAIEAALKEASNKDFTVKELPGLNHLFQTCKTGGVSEYAGIEETFAPAALELITTWITQRTKP
jgi:pimeloyl-ACP methyl ester carboxylesterase